jgi:norsolorinic acid ketoreductase
MEVDHIVIAANRNPDHPTSQELYSLPKAQGSRLIMVKLDILSEEDAFTAVESLQVVHGVNHLDVVIANAGISSIWPTVATLRLTDLQAHMDVNSYGVIRLYQATRSLLQMGSKEPMFVSMGSLAGCIG